MATATSTACAGATTRYLRELGELYDRTPKPAARGATPCIAESRGVKCRDLTAGRGSARRFPGTPA